MAHHTSPTPKPELIYLPITLTTGCLTVLAALFLADFVLMFLTVFKGTSQGKATGLGVLAALMVESLFSPLFWLLALTFFAVFFATGRLSNSVLKGLLFWFPTILTSTLGVGLLSCFALLMLRLKRS